MTAPVHQEACLIESAPADAAFNMAFDEALLEAMPRLGAPVLRFYGWAEPAASFGYFQKYAQVAAATLMRPLVRRPTGGGMVPHDADWTYSLAFPANHFWHSLSAIESYHRVHEWIQAAFAQLGVKTDLAPESRRTGLGQCFAGYERSDVLWSGRKVAGAAQRRTRTGLLIQGSVQPPPIGISRTDWQQRMADAGRRAQSLQWREMPPDPILNQRVLTLAREKYSQRSYNEKR